MNLPAVLVEAVRQGLGLLLWNQESFAYADSFDEAQGRYRGLRAGQHLSLSDNDLTGLLVKPDVALRQLEQEKPLATAEDVVGSLTADSDQQTTEPASVGASTEAGVKPRPSAPKRYHGSVSLDPTRAGRDAGRIADEVLAHLAGLVGADVAVTLEIEASIPSGAPDHVVRTVTENSRTLKFRDSGFEQE